MKFRNREHAAELLIQRLRTSYKNKNPLVLGVPRGAVPMAKMIANALGGELDVVLVHKLTLPEQPELAIGAIDEQGNAFVSDWAAFVEYFEAMRGYGLVEAMKDFYWDIRPKPEYGTVEIRVFDTPLTVERAAVLAVYAQALARHILVDRPLSPERDVYTLYNYNRFQACRYGLDAKLVDAYTQRTVSLREELIDTVKLLAPHSAALGNGGVLARLATDAEAGRSDAAWLRQAYKERKSLNDVARLQSEEWMGKAGAPSS